jgi:hypothetical protein
VTVAVLDWTRRLTCDGCGAEARTATGHTATAAGWLCERCLEAALGAVCNADDGA